MSRQLLIYDRVTAIGSVSHSDVSVEIGGSYAFAAKVNSVPLLSIEFEAAALNHPIVFARNGSSLFPTALLGLRPDHNEYVDFDGSWTGGYLPAFLRRYPFIFSRHEGQDEKSFTLCLDEAYQGVNREGRGERLFDDAGVQTPWLDRQLSFTVEYQSQFLHTQAFCAHLDRLGLLDDAQAIYRGASGIQGSMGGFSVLNRSRLKQIPEAEMQALFRNGGLSICYAHLHSLQNILKLGQAARYSGVPEIQAIRAA